MDLQLAGQTVMVTGSPGAIIAVDHGATAASHMNRQVPDMPGFPSKVPLDTAATERLRHAGSTNG